MEDEELRVHKKFDIKHINRMLEPHNLKLVLDWESREYRILTEMETKAMELEQFKDELTAMNRAFENLRESIPMVEKQIADLEKELEEYGKNQEKR